LPCAPPRMLMLTQLLLALLLCVAACAPKFERPNITVVGIEMQHGNLLQQNFQVKFHIQNPNDRALPVKGLHADLRVGGDRIASGATDRAFVVPPFGETDFDMMITANMAMALLKLANQHADSIDYDVSGSASLDLTFLNNVPFRQNGSFSLKALQ
jgi:LEA14-like dessication related protein